MTVAAAAGQVLHATDKSTVVRVRWHDQQAVVKRLVSDEPYWRQRMAHERHVYAHLTDVPVLVPGLLHVDDDRLVLSELPGAVVHPDRFPGPLPEAAVLAVIETLRTLHAWTPPPAMPQVDHLDRLAYQLATCQMFSDDAVLIRRLLARWPETLRFEHGDPLPTNFLLDRDAVAVLDFEYAGLHLPGTDWALLRLLWGPANPWLCAVIDDLVDQEDIAVPYTIALFSLACRESRLCRSWPVGDERIAVVRAAVVHTRQLLQDVAGSLS